MKDTILFGDCKETLSAFLPQSARTCVTSPPYYGLRDYGTATWVGGDPNCKHRKVGKQGSNCITDRLCEATCDSWLLLYVHHI